MTDKLHSTVLRQIADGTPSTAVDVFGPTLEFISGPDDPGADFWVMRGVVPPGVVVPLHSHNDAEDFFILSGTQQVLTKSDQGLQWRDVNAGDYVHSDHRATGADIHHYLHSYAGNTPHVCAGAMGQCRVGQRCDELPSGCRIKKWSTTGHSARAH